MDHIRKNNKVRLVSKKDSSVIDGIIFDFTKDRIKIIVNDDCINIASNICELDEMLATFATVCGKQTMEGHIIDSLDKNNFITIENNPEIPIIQKRRFVRVVSQFNFTAYNKNNRPLNCACVNISAGGIAFKTTDNSFSEGDIVKIILPEEIFEKPIQCEIKILKSFDFGFAARFLNLNMYNEDKIVKHIFKLMSNNVKD